MSKWDSILKLALISSMMVVPTTFAAYSSGSSGADGPFNPTESQAIQLPADGIFNYSSVNIPTGVTITYIKNAGNTPVVILSSTDVVIDGTIDVSAVATDVTGAGKGGPGGFDGGAAGKGVPQAGWVEGFDSPNIGRAGIGPGGGSPAPLKKGPIVSTSTWNFTSGGGGGYATASVSSGLCPTTPGVVYGNESLVPLIGGSGGGGGNGGVTQSGTGGGGGGGAILIAASGTISVAGKILANGGTPASTSILGDSAGSTGGGGSGGAIRLIATTVTGNGAISAAGGTPAPYNFSNGTIGVYGCAASQMNNAQLGGQGRIRIDAESLNRTVATTPPWSRGTPSLAFVPGLPSLTITSIGGVTVPAGNSTIDLAAGFTNPVTVNFVTTGVTVGSTIKLTVSPAKGPTYSATSAPTAGSTENASGSATVTLNPGTNTIQASVTYTVVASLGDALSNYAKGERVESVTVASVLGGSSMITLTTVTGKQHVVPASVLATAQAKS